MRIFSYLCVLFLLLAHTLSLGGPRERVTADIDEGKPIIIHVTVALADNKHQWIVKVPELIGNGQDPRSNLYWGARYGLKTFLKRDGNWQLLKTLKTKDKRILERIILYKTFRRNDKNVKIYLVADAWDGRYINDTIKQFLRFNGGHDKLSLNLGTTTIQAGGNAHLIAYIGHNALMDYAGLKSVVTSTVSTATTNPNNEAIVLACKSQPYFRDRLQQLDANPLVLTTGLMAPEAYTLNAAVSKWIEGGSDRQVRQAAASSYNKYQKTGKKAANNLFNAN